MTRLLKIFLKHIAIFPIRFHALVRCFRMPFSQNRVTLPRDMHSFLLTAEPTGVHDLNGATQ